MIENKLVDIAVVTSPMDSNKKLHTTVLSTLREVPVCSMNFNIKNADLHSSSVAIATKSSRCFELTTNEEISEIFSLIST